MNKRKLALLERAFSAEIDSALSGGLGIMQTRSKLADDLVLDGYLAKAKRTIAGHLSVTRDGYVLTELGRYAYCVSCE